MNCGCPVPVVVVKPGAFSRRIGEENPWQYERMRLLRRAWRSIFARADLPTDAAFGLDDSRSMLTALVITVPFVPVALVFAVSALIGAKGAIANIVTTVIVVVLLFGTVLAIHAVGSERIVRRFAERRSSIAAPAAEAGWEYSEATLPPSPQTLEAVFHYSRTKLQVASFTEVTTGMFSGHRFTAGHIDGNEVRQAGERGPGLPRSENVVVMSLPGLLPELKLRDRTTSILRDYGWSLAIAPTGDPEFDRRWEVQTNFADFAADLFTPQLRDFLKAVPLVPCTIVIRNGYITASRDPEATFASVSRRLEILTGFVDRIPARVWERETSPQVAGAGLRHGYRKKFYGPGI